MSEQEEKQLVKCPKCGQDKGELEFTESAVKEFHSLPGEKKYGQRGHLSFYQCQNCGHKWDLFSGDSGPLWTLPIED